MKGDDRKLSSSDSTELANELLSTAQVHQEQANKNPLQQDCQLTLDPITLYMR